MIAVAFALEFEAALFRSHDCQWPGVEIWLLKATGERSANSLQQRLEIAKPSSLISAGFGGGLQPGLQVGDLIICENFTDPALASKLQLSEAWRMGRLITAPAIVEKAKDKKNLGLSTGALVADLETAHLAEICQRLEVPMVAMRAISDVMEEDIPVPSEVLLSSKTGRPDPFALFRHVISHPKAMAGAGRLFKNARIAQAKLAEGLKEIVPQILSLHSEKACSLNRK